MAWLSRISGLGCSLPSHDMESFVGHFRPNLLISCEALFEVPLLAIVMLAIFTLSFLFPKPALRPKPALKAGRTGT